MRLKLSLFLISFSMMSFQEDELSKIYSAKRVAKLREVLQYHLANPQPSDIPALIGALETHIELIRNVKIGPEARENFLAGLELYGETVRILENSIVEYFNKFALSVVRVPSPLLAQCIQDLVSKPGSPLVDQGIASRYVRDGTTLYLQLSADTKFDEVDITLAQLQELLKLKISSATDAEISQLVQLKGWIPIFRVKTVLSYDSYYLIGYDFEIKATHGARNLANRSRHILYKKQDNALRSINYIGTNGIQ